MAHRAFRFHRLAGEEYRKARRWYSTQASAEVARRFRDEVDSALRRIADHPETWPIYLGEFRWIRLRRFPYLLVFITLESEVVVVAVAHASRRPGYWRRRSADS